MKKILLALIITLSLYSGFFMLKSYALTPTSTSSPSPSEVPDTFLLFTIGLDGIGSAGGSSIGINQDPKTKERDLSIRVFDSEGGLFLEKTDVMIYNPQIGKFEGKIGLGSDFKSGAYSIEVYTKGYLSKLLPAPKNIFSKQRNTTTTVNLVAGDIRVDNSLSVLDYNILLSCSVFSNDRNALCNLEKDFYTLSDLENNGTVDEFDYNLFIREFSLINEE